MRFFCFAKATLVLLLSSLFFISCSLSTEEGVSFQEVTSFETETESSLYSQEEIDIAIVEILSDLETIHNEISEVDNELLRRELKLLVDNPKQLESLSFKEFVVNELRVNAEIFSTLSDYTDLKKKLFLAQFTNHSESDVVFNYWSSHKSDFNFKINSGKPQSQGLEYAKACSPDCCGGWRPIRIIGESVACVVAPNVWTCGWAAFDHYMFASDNCWE